ncbi:hypothetical protein ACHHYP_03845 [Achlya hypogyna]|uniref:Uncharacterized protein n=1 Tax=Achlya hypogyna TaxID=1202772 RepID=A0A1V9Z2Q7_ACHHY|nr:hypothetical protein ACHHYP_03845 [Achlya hypogyna]
MATQKSRGDLRGMEIHVEQVLDSVRQVALKKYSGAAPKKPPALAHAAWKCHAALGAMRRTSRSIFQSSEDSASGDDLRQTNDAASVKRVDHQLKRYAQHYFNGLSACSAVKGTTKLSLVIESAVQQQTKCRHKSETGASVGVAILSQSGEVFTASTQDPGLDICPERLALLKLTSDDGDHCVEGVAISSSDPLFYPYPCGNCREFMAQFGDFPVYLIRKSLEYERTSSHALYPQALKQPIILPSHPKTTVAQPHLRERSKLPPKDWGLDHVVDWLIEDVGLQEYARTFQAHHVDGAMLSYLQESDLEYLLCIENPLHRRRLGVSLDRLRDAEKSQDGIAFGQLQDYLAVLDMDRINMVVKLKHAFDAVDTNKDGAIGFEAVRAALARLEYSVNASSVEAWIQARTPDARVSFPEFALAYCSTWTASTPTAMLPVPKLDLVAIRQSFERVDADGSGVIERAELVRALEQLGRTDCEIKAAEWFAQVDEDASGTISFPEFIFRYTQLQGTDISPLRQAFDRIAKGELRCQVKSLPRFFRDLYVRYDDAALDKYMAARTETSPGLSFAETILVYFLFVTEPEPIATTEMYHKHRIVQLQHSGHVRLCTKSPEAYSPEKRHETAKSQEEPSKLMQYQRATKQQAVQEAKHESKEDDDDSEDEGKLQDEFANVHNTFRRFQAKRLTTPEALQALTELGIVLPRAQMLEYFTRHGFGTMREITYADLVRSYQQLRQVKPAYSRASARRHQRLHHSHAQKMQAAKALLNGELGKPFTREEFDAYYRRQHKHQQEGKDDDDDDSPQRKQRADELHRLCRQNVAQPNSKANPSDSDDDGSVGDVPRRSRQKFEIGDRVADKTRSWGPGTLIRLYESYGAGDVHFDSGLKRRNVALSSLRRFRDAPLASFATPSPFAVGDAVLVRYHGTKLWRAATVRKVRPHLEYDVAYAGREVEKHVPHRYVRRAFAADDATEEFQEGAKVEARTKESATYRPGRVVGVRPNGTYDVRFEHEKAVKERLPRHWLRKRDGDTGDTGDTGDDDEEGGVGLTEGDCVEARFEGQHAYLSGIIARCRSDGSCDIEYDNGEIERRVEKDLIRKITPLAKGDAVEARFGGKDKYFKGRVVHVHGDKTLDIEYEDGDEERRVDPKLVRRMQVSATEFVKGSAVEARFGGKDKYFKGRVVHVHGDKTLDIEYEDGDEERRVDPKLVRALPTASKTQQDKYFKGKIAHVHSDGSLDIEYDDGDEERRVDPTLVRALPTASKASQFTKGDVVEARFGGKDKYFKGKIAHVHSDGSLDVAYDDGDEERRVKPELVRSLADAYEDEDAFEE